MQRSTSEQEAARSCRGTHRPGPARCSQAAPVSGHGEPGHIVLTAALPGAQETSLPSPGANSSKETGPVPLQGK